MENLIQSCINAAISGGIEGIELLWDALTTHPLLFAFFTFLLLRKLKYTFF